MWELILVEMLVVAGITGFLYNSFGSFKKRPWYVTTSVLIGWFLSFSLVYLMPVDVASTKHEDCIAGNHNNNISDFSPSILSNSSNSNGTHSCSKPFMYIPFRVRKILWEIIYWSTYITTWVVYPLLQGYVTTGEFGVFRRCVSALRQNLIFYGVAGALVAIAVLYIVLAEGFALKDIPGIAIALSNTWGLLLLILLLGHGLVDVPRTLWRRSNKQLMMRHYLFELSRYDQKLQEAKQYLHKQLRKVRYVDQNTPPMSPLRRYVDELLMNAPFEQHPEASGVQSVDILYSKLVSINYKVKVAEHNANMYNALYAYYLKKAINLEDVLNSEGKWHIAWSFQPRRASKLLNLLEYLWHVHMRSNMRLLFFVVCSLVSLAVVWSEVVLPIKQIDLSVLSRLINIPGITDFALQCLIFFPFLYIAFCTYSSLFQLKLFNYYHLIGHSQTDSNSLLFSAAYLSRLTAPMCYNFLLLIRSDESAFLRVMGQIQTIPILGKAFNEYVPLVIAVVCLATLFNLYARILDCLNIPRFQFDEDFTHKNIDEGKELLAAERQRLRAMPLPRLPSDDVMAPLTRSRPQRPPSDVVARTQVSQNLIDGRQLGLHENRPIDFEDPRESEALSNRASVNSDSGFSRLWRVFRELAPSPAYEALDKTSERGAAYGTR